MGDIESQPYLEAIRQFRREVGRENTLYIHLTLVPFMGTAGELKTKPTQHSVRDLRSIGIQPDILLCRTDRFLPRDIRRKIALFCDVDEEAVITALDVDTIYEVPLVLREEGLDEIVLKGLRLPTDTECDVKDWHALVEGIKHPTSQVTVHVVGKYVGYEDSYKSLNERCITAVSVRGSVSPSSGSRPKRSNRKVESSFSPTPTASSCREGSATAEAAA